MNVVKKDNNLKTSSSNIVNDEEFLGLKELYERLKLKYNK